VPGNGGNVARYERIAPFYDLLDLAFERRRYRALRPLLFQGLGGRLLDAGIGASFDRETERRIPEAGLELVESRYVVADLLKLLTVRVADRGPASAG
jgi:hypothetical protein